MKPIAIIIHHSVTRSNISAESLRAIFKQRFGVDYIGYHYVVRGDGSILKDLRDDQIGIHNNLGAYNNTNSLGVCLAGDFTQYSPTEDQLRKLESLLDELRAKHGVSRDKVFGHRDFKATTCPSDYLYNWIKQYKNKGINNNKDMNTRVFQQGDDTVLEAGSKTYAFDTPRDVDIFTEGKINPSPSPKQLGHPKQAQRISFTKAVNYDKDVANASQTGYTKGVEDGSKNAPVKIVEKIVEKPVEVIKEVKVPTEDLTSLEYFRLALKALFNWTNKDK